MMEEYTKRDVTQASELGRCGTTSMNFNRIFSDKCSREGGSEAVFGSLSAMAGFTSWDCQGPSSDNSFERVQRSTKPFLSPDHVLAYDFGQSNPRSLAPAVGPRATAPGAAEPLSDGEKARDAWITIANKYRGLEQSVGRDGSTWSQAHNDLIPKTAQEIMWELLQDPTFDGAFLQDLLFKKFRSKFGQPSTVGSPVGEKPCCKFCRNNNEEETDHTFKDANGLVLCPVLFKHVCDLCGVSGPLAHTRKYCPQNPLTLGCPEEAGFPPGMLPKDVYETTQVMMRMMKARKSV